MKDKKKLDELERILIRIKFAKATRERKIKYKKT